MRSLILALPLLFLLNHTAFADGDSLFAVAGVHTIRITFQQPAFWDSLTLYYTLDKMMEADVEIDGRLVPNSGVQLKGGSSYIYYPGVKKPIDLDFNVFVPDQTYNGLSRLNLGNGYKDPTMMREKLFLDFCAQAGLPAPRCTYANVYLNDTYWGLYSVVEQVNRKFLGNWFANNDGNLFKGDPSGTLVWKGPLPELYYGDYELKTNEPANDWSGLVTLIDRINNTPDPEFALTIGLFLETGNWISYQAANLLFANLDSYSGSGHNYYLYQDPSDSLFRFIVWDANESFGTFTMGLSPDSLADLSVFYIPAPASSRPLTNRMLAVPEFRSAYLDQLCMLAGTRFRNEVLGPLIDSLADAIRSDYYADPNKMFTDAQFEQNIVEAVTVQGLPGGSVIAGLKPFIASRRQSRGIPSRPSIP